MELRELEAKLKAGYMNRERAAQLAEKRLLEIDEQVSENFKNYGMCKPVFWTILTTINEFLIGIYRCHYS